MKGVLIVLFACVFFLKQTPFWGRLAPGSPVCDSN